MGLYTAANDDDDDCGGEPMKATAKDEVLWAVECLNEIITLTGPDYRDVIPACLADLRFSTISLALVEWNAQEAEGAVDFINAALEEAGFPLLGEAEEDGTW